MQLSDTNKLDKTVIVTTPEKIYDGIGLVITAWLIASIIHRMRHYPWRCDELCPWWVK